MTPRTVAMTPSTTVANLALGLLPALSAADVMDVIAAALNELNHRGGEIANRTIETSFGDIETNSDGKYGSVFHCLGIATDASRPMGGIE